ncbi:MAG: CBS domain-containing protein, partial [Pseudorhodobacter sp.]|nr:CBS domain-containing protein [Rhizobacter sp.]
MTTVKTCLEQKPQPIVLVSVAPDDRVVTALQLMRDNRVRAVLVMEGER